LLSDEEPHSPDSDGSLQLDLGVATGLVLLVRRSDQGEGGDRRRADLLDVRDTWLLLPNTTEQAEQVSGSRRAMPLH